MSGIRESNPPPRLGKPMPQIFRILDVCWWCNILTISLLRQIFVIIYILLVQSAVLVIEQDADLVPFALDLLDGSVAIIIDPP